MEQFAKLLKVARTGAGLTQKELASQVGVDDSYISKIEREVYDPPTRDKVIAIADTLAITDPTERYRFLLSANCAGLDDLEALQVDATSQGAVSEAVGAPRFGAGIPLVPRTRAGILRDILHHMHDVTAMLEELLELEEADR